MLRQRHLLVVSMLLLQLAGCSDPAARPPLQEEPSCKNVIVYSLSGDVYLTATHRYDDAGNIIEYVETNSLGDDVLIMTRSFDERNRRVEQVIDTTRFDPSHREMTWEYDEQGRVIRSTYDGWGQDKKFRDSRIFYEDLGRREHIEIAENGSPVDVLKYVYIEGEPFIVEERHLDVSDETLKYGFRYRFVQGRWLERIEIFNGELVQAAEWYTYADVSLGMVSRRDVDGNADGIADEVGTYFWSAEGLMERADYDTTADGKVEQRYTYEYDTAGKLTRRRWSVFDQGSLEFVTDFTWSTDRLTRVERKDDMTGIGIESWSFEYGCPGNLPMDVPVSPIQGFRYEMATLPMNVDSSTWWTSFDAF